MPSTDSVEALGNDGTVQNWRATEVGKYIICQRGFQYRQALAFNCRVRAASQWKADNTMDDLRRVPRRRWRKRVNRGYELIVRVWERFLAGSLSD